MAEPDRFPLHEVEHTGCPTSCLVPAGVLAAASAALYLLVPAKHLLRHALDEGAAVPGIALFVLLVLLHLGVGGIRLPYGSSRAHLQRIAQTLQGRMSPDPSRHGWVRIEGRAGTRAVEIRVRAKGGLFGHDEASIRVAANSPIPLEATARVETDPHHRAASRNSGLRFVLESVRTPGMTQRQLFARAPRLERSLRKATQRGVKSITVSTDAVTARVQGVYVNSPRLVQGMLEGLRSVADALEALQATPEVLDLSVAPVERSPRTCPYCREDLDRLDAVACAESDTRHHRECFDEFGRCSLLGCGGVRRVPIGA